MIDEKYLMVCMLKGLMEDKQYATTIMMVFDENYFDDISMASIFSVTKKHINEFNTLPDKDIIINSVPLDTKDGVIALFKESEDTDFSVSKNYDWLLEESNLYLKDKAIKRAIVESVDLIDAGKNIQQIKSLIETALCKDIQIDLGLDYFKDLSNRLLRVFNTSDQRVKTYYPTLDDLFNGGYPPYTLNMMIARIHGHKCVSSETLIHLRDDLTGKIKEIKIIKY